jgi:S1-C subfamily serine protease
MDRTPAGPTGEPSRSAETEGHSCPDAESDKSGVDFAGASENRVGGGATEGPAGKVATVFSGAGERGNEPAASPTRTLIFRRFDPSQLSAGSSDERDEIQHAAQQDPQDERPRLIGTTESRRSEPVLHALVLLAVVAVMLAAARFIVPGIVEEIRYAQHRGQLRAEFEVAGEGLKNVSLDTLSQAYEMVNAAAGPSVVHIDVRRTEAPEVHPIRTGGPPNAGVPLAPISDQGSGVIVDQDGYLLTNCHVIAGADELSVTLSDGRTVAAEIVGVDPPTDLALLKIEAGGLFPIPWGDSERIRVGSPVWAIGSPFGLDRTVTFGILSGKHRVVRASDRYQDFMQSDVAVNPGNSGGPLVDSRGTLIGINTAIVGDTYQGVSFSVPSNVARKVFEQLRGSGIVRRGWLGVQLAEVPSDSLQSDDHRFRGALIVAIADADSGAADAGLQAGDVVVAVDGNAIRDVNHLMQEIGNAMAGTSVELTIARGEDQLDVPVTLGRRPLDRS